MYKNSVEFKALAEKQGIIRTILDKENIHFEKDHHEVYEQLREVLKVMSHSKSASIEEPEHYQGHLIGGDAQKLFNYEGENYCGNAVRIAMSYALSSSEVNASMGKICAAPTAGSCGILPAALFVAKEQLDLSEEDMLDGLMVASMIGELITINATVSGAEGGCQAECGSAAAMASGMLVYLRKGSLDAVFHAAAITIKNILGLVCDPIAGLVESPCAKRNASGVVNAMASADLALAGIQSIVPFDEVVHAMWKVGQSLPATLKETALGGIAATKTAKAIELKIRNT